MRAVVECRRNSLSLVACLSEGISKHATTNNLAGGLLELCVNASVSFLLEWFEWSEWFSGVRLGSGLGRVPGASGARGPGRGQEDRGLKVGSADFQLGRKARQCPKTPKDRRHEMQPRSERWLGFVMLARALLLNMMLGCSSVGPMPPWMVYVHEFLNTFTSELCCSLAS